MTHSSREKLDDEITSLANEMRDRQFEAGQSEARFHVLTHAGSAAATLTFVGTFKASLSTPVLAATLASLTSFVLGLIALSFVYSHITNAIGTLSQAMEMLKKGDAVVANKMIARGRNKNQTSFWLLASLTLMRLGLILGLVAIILVVFSPDDAKAGVSIAALAATAEDSISLSNSWLTNVTADGWLSFAGAFLGALAAVGAAFYASSRTDQANRLLEEARSNKRQQAIMQMLANEISNIISPLVLEISMPDGKNTREEWKQLEKIVPVDLKQILADQTVVYQRASDEIGSLANIPDQEALHLLDWIVSFYGQFSYISHRLRVPGSLNVNLEMGFFVALLVTAFFALEALSSQCSTKVKNVEDCMDRIRIHLCYHLKRHSDLPQKTLLNSIDLLPWLADYQIEALENLRSQVLEEQNSNQDAFPHPRTFL